MPTGQLQFVRSKDSWYASLGPSSYAIVRPIDTSAPNAKYNAIYLGTLVSPVATTLGTFDRFNDAINACQTNYTAS